MTRLLLVLSCLLFLACSQESAPYPFVDKTTNIEVVFPYTPYHTQTEEQPRFRRLVECKDDTSGYFLKLEHNPLGTDRNAVLQGQANHLRVMHEQGFTSTQCSDTMYAGYPAQYCISRKSEQVVFMLLCYTDSIRVEASAFLVKETPNSAVVQNFFQSLRIP